MDQNWTQSQVFCHFLKFGSLVFHEIAYSDSLQQFLTTTRDNIHEKIFGNQIWAITGRNRTQNQVFCHLLKLGSLVFHEIACNDSLQQFLTSITGKIHKKTFGDQIWAQIRPKIRFFAIFSSLVHQFSLKLHRMIAWNNVSILVQVKPAKQVAKQAKIGSRINFFCHFLKFGLLVFLEITQMVAWNIV